MTPAVWPRSERGKTRMLHVDPEAGTLVDRTVRDLPELLRAGDVVVVNDAATMPASLAGRTRFGLVEIRLAATGETARDWIAVVFGAGSWRERTEDRITPPPLRVGDAIEFAGGLRARIVAVSSLSPRLVELQFDLDGAEFWPALYRAGRPVQYSYLAAPLALWHVQTTYAGRPWAVEMPSAGWAVTPALVSALRRRRVSVVHITHAAGLSATGDPAIDAALPLPERYEIPAATVAAIAAARDARGRVVAIGTSVVRALESAAQEAGSGAHRLLGTGAGVTDLRIGPGFVPRVVDGLLTGIHTPETSHFSLVNAFVPAVTLRAALEHAESAGYLGHEFGDTSFILAAAVSRAS